MTNNPDDPEVSEAEVTQEGDDIMVDWRTDGKGAGSVYRGPN